jgi:hypothetical protein
LDNLLLPHNLDAGEAGFPFLVDGNNHAATGDGEGGGNSDVVSVMVNITDRISTLTRRR